MGLGQLTCVTVEWRLKVEWRMCWGGHEREALRARACLLPA